MEWLLLCHHQFPFVWPREGRSLTTSRRPRFLICKVERTMWTELAHYEAPTWSLVWFQVGYKIWGTYNVNRMNSRASMTLGKGLCLQTSVPTAVSSGVHMRWFLRVLQIVVTMYKLYYMESTLYVNIYVCACLCTHWLHTHIWAHFILSKLWDLGNFVSTVRRKEARLGEGEQTSKVITPKSGTPGV